MKKWRQKSSCVAIFGNTEVKKSLPQIVHLRRRKSRISTAAERAASLLEI
jgi:hypothetical protein